MKKLIIFVFVLLVFSIFVFADEAKPDLVIEDVVFEDQELLQSVPLDVKVLIKNAGDIPIATRLPYNLGGTGWSAFTYFHGKEGLEEDVEFVIRKPDGSTRIELNTPKQITYHKSALSEEELAEEYKMERISFVMEKIREKKLEQDPTITENEYDPENPTDIEPIQTLDVEVEFQKLTDEQKAEFESKWQERKASLMEEYAGTLNAPAITLNPGEIVEVPFKWTFKIKGFPIKYEFSSESETNTVYIVLDPQNDVIESDETNNVFSKEYQVAGSIIFGPREETEFYPGLTKESDYFIFANGNFCVNLDEKEVCHSVTREDGTKVMRLSVDGLEEVNNVGWVSSFLKMFWGFFTGNDEILPKQKVGDVTFRFYQEGLRVTFE
ncbi:MAG: hypothetical protein KJ771_04530 [Nanoarchaeota archaeon]|nr:hypothetical protein [Nanoarchaeota archaeon]